MRDLIDPTPDNAARVYRALALFGASLTEALDRPKDRLDLDLLRRHRRG